VKTIPISKVEFGADVEAKVLEVLRSGVIAQGPVVAELERNFAEMLGVRNVVAVNNGTTSLFAALQVLELKEGDEVITSPFTFVATINAILNSGATVRFADISETDFNLRPELIRGLVNSATRVLLPVHLYGQAADMGAISGIAADAGLEILEDAAQAHMATFEGRKVGTWGTGSFSLYATKNLTSGEGGLISTNSDELADKLRVLRNQGMRQRYQYEIAGNNFRMTDLQAAVCVPQLSKYSEVVASRRRNAEFLSEALGRVTWLKTPKEVQGRQHVWHQYTLLVDRDAPVSRDVLSEILTEAGVGSGFYYPKVVFDYECYLRDPRVVQDHVPVAFDVASRCISIPVHQGLTREDLVHIVNTISGVK